MRYAVLRRLALSTCEIQRRSAAVKAAGTQTTVGCFGIVGPHGADSMSRSGEPCARKPLRPCVYFILSRQGSASARSRFREQDHRGAYHHTANHDLRISSSDHGTPLGQKFKRTQKDA